MRGIEAKLDELAADPAMRRFVDSMRGHVEAFDLAGHAGRYWTALRARSDPCHDRQPRDIVLVVDDLPETLGFLTDALEAPGYDGAGRHVGGSRRSSIAEQITPDMVLMDAMMPGHGRL